MSNLSYFSAGSEEGSYEYSKRQLQKWYNGELNYTQPGYQYSGTMMITSKKAGIDKIFGQITEFG